MRSMVNVHHTEYQEKANTYRENIAVTVYLFERYKKLFEKIEEQGTFGSTEQDSFLYEQRYVTNVNKITHAIYDLRNMLIKIWKEAC